MPRTAFFAFPSGPQFLADTISSGVSQINQSELIITPWPELNIQGLKVDNLIRDRIESSDFLVADITYPNFNVYYEVGYAIGSRKPVVPTVNVAVDKASENLNLTGLFDTTGQNRYQNGHELASELQKTQPEDWAHHYIRGKDHTQPLFVLDSLPKTEFRNYIFQTIGNSKLEYRAFDPLENPRLSLTFAVGAISSSSGVILPLLSTEIVDWQRHNLRAAFLAGLCHGFEVDVKIIQYEDVPAPLDYRDFIETTRTKHEVTQAIAEYCQQTLIRNQQRTDIRRRRARSILDEIDVGASAAENETGKLGYYFLRTAQFARALRADSAIVVGRKGSGKSAIFFQIIEEKKKHTKNVVLDLRPASHSLSELRHELLSVLSVGVFEHTIAAFWQYIVYAEILLKLREETLPAAKYNFTMLKKIEALEKQLRLTDAMVSGDFTSRLELAIQAIIVRVRERSDAAELKEKFTNLLFENELPQLRDAVVSLAEGSPIIFLLDDLDKGWPARQVEQHDIRTIEHLLAVLNRIQRDLRRRGVELQHLLFLRSDVYETLVAETADRGKYNVIRVDWSDPLQLELLIQERIISNFEEDGAAAQAWNAVNPPLGSGTAVRAMIASSLMRPRFLIDICEKAISFAINRAHSTVNVEDVEDALRQHSLYLVSDFGYEIRDVTGLSEKIFYKFLGYGSTLTPDEVHAAVSDVHLGMGGDRIIELLLWYGFLGISGANGPPVFIYDREYDIRRLEAERDAQGAELRFVVNPAFMRGLQK
jgi:hypothetical protein